MADAPLTTKRRAASAARVSAVLASAISAVATVACGGSRAEQPPAEPLEAIGFDVDLAHEEFVILGWCDGDVLTVRASWLSHCVAFRYETRLGAPALRSGADRVAAVARGIGSCAAWLGGATGPDTDERTGEERTRAQREAQWAAAALPVIPAEPLSHVVDAGTTRAACLRPARDVAITVDGAQLRTDADGRIAVRLTGSPTRVGHAERYWLFECPAAADAAAGASRGP